MIKTIEWVDGAVRMIDQTRLPTEKVFVDCKTIEEVSRSIKTMIIRGAPAIGVAAAMGVSLGADAILSEDFDEFYAQLEEKCVGACQIAPDRCQPGLGHRPHETGGQSRKRTRHSRN